MAKTDYKTIDDYHKAFKGEALTRLKSIRAIIHELVPGVEEDISYQIPRFKYKGYLIYYCAFPKHISLSYPYSLPFWEHFKSQLEGLKTSKAVIQFPADKPLPEELIRSIVSYRKEENEEIIKSKQLSLTK